jgi:D-sedoheptulose 7-phosphate isomerase
MDVLKKKLFDSIKENINLKKKLITLDKKVNQSVQLIYKTFENENKILICGNGGSAADAQHLSAEYLVRLRPKINRKPLPVISLALDTSTITACGNDYSFDKLFSRNFEALAKNGDLLICISTSGNSKNILNVLKAAKKKKIQSISFLGNGGGEAKKLSTLNIIVPNSNTARIQEAHIFLGHFIFETVEDLMIKKRLI